MKIKPNRELEKYIDNYPHEWQIQIEEYFNGERQNFDIKFEELPGTEFQQDVLREMLKIPFGKTRSYKRIAELVGRPKAYRAVANVCAINPYPVIIPCHRVVATNGIGGFSLGLDMKKQLLRLESN